MTTASKKYRYTVPIGSNHVLHKIVDMVPSGSRVLEIGCSSGSQTRILKENLGCRVTGIEIDAVAAADAREFCEKLVIGDIESINLAEHVGALPFDVIILADVLEHLRNPSDTLVKIRPMLGQHGILLASIPNIAHAAICWELAHGRFDYRDFGLLDDTHIRFYTKKSITHLFECSGYYIAAWDRITMRAEETEFDVHPVTKEGSAFLDWIHTQNPEADTFQFIVRAHSTEQRSMFESDLQQVKEKLSAALFEIQQLKNDNQKLASENDWLENRTFGGLASLYDTLRKCLSASKKG